MTTGLLVENAIVRDAQLLTPRELLYRPYILPFIPLYGIFLHIYFNDYERFIGGSEWTFVFLCALITLNLLIALLPEWNVDLAAKFRYRYCSTLEEASHILLRTTPNNGSDGIVKIERDRDESGLQVFFQFQKKRFLWHPEDSAFSSPKFLIDNEPKLKVFQDVKGNSGDLSQLKRLYGQNTFDIPVPTFIDLFKEHAVAPFFVFQVFCVALWLFDEMLYLSIFNLFMLIVLEAAAVFQRLVTLKEFRTMGVKPFSLNVFRDGKWTNIISSELLPMDVVSITRTPEDGALPCDLILIDGTCIVNEAMLSGESTPLLKESIKLRPATDKLEVNGLDKNAILHGGTKVLQVTTPENGTNNIPLPPDDGAIGVVTKTGFETSQGSLVRVMIYSSERISAGSKEAFYFILLLLLFAIMASWYVWVEGSKMGRIQSKLILDCILIITSVVPSELPMELTMAVNSSLTALSKFYIYCTEPFRIPLAGRIDVCCFDKTGTLTAEELVFEGLAGLSDDKEDIHHLFSGSETPMETSLVIGAGHALVQLDDGEVVGDPMEKATISATGWTVGKKDSLTHEKYGNLLILRRFQFSSALKRSSSIAMRNKQLFAAVKGAPETIRERLVTVPSNYDAIYKSFTRSGSRVLALASKKLPNLSKSQIEKTERDTIEVDLEFRGFLVFHCPLKSDAIETVKMLNESSHRCIIITGDNPLTAVHVAKEVAIVYRETLILDQPIDGADHALVLRNVDETIVIPFDLSFDKFGLSEIYNKYDLAVTGYALNMLSEYPHLKDLIRHTWVYARVSPTQKEFILNELKEMGYLTLMCGDGTNDVGALKQAHVGVALLNGTEEGLKKLQEQRRLDNMKGMYEKQCALMERWGQQLPPVPQPIAHLYPPGPSNPHYLTALEQKGVKITPEMRALAIETAKMKTIAPKNKSDQSQQSATDLASAVLSNLGNAEAEDAPSLKLGDASCAAPFTSKLANVAAVTNIIRQGRCALVNTIEMYKILALNSLISAYSLSVLYLAGVKLGDAQATVSTILISVCFLSISRGQPLQKLSKERPQHGIFNTYIMGSIFGQFAVHIVSLVYITLEIYKIEPREPKVDLEKTFEPSLLNTGIFLIQLAQQVSTFAVNYQGVPFREDIRNNKGMLYGLLGVAGLALTGATEFFPELNEAMKFVPMDDMFKIKLTATLLFDYAGSWIVETVLKSLFMNSEAADIAKRD
ncbi:HFL192Wp [Eremothecium sinecaudum]|uniref:HFL192Wp n=1 Tax=Eremothecium sinecaudum TaxID=45286 RepID=A0A0X8HUF1_9SACH|nr:HFL192Wp [Eremothecium sinecaudum]AMD21664.1 HFL192Wp [Eremothecium sinecaudum]